MRRGEKGSLVFFYKETNGHKDGAAAENGDATADRRYIMRASVVFNADQVDGVSRGLEPTTGETWTTENFDDFVAMTGAVVRFGGSQAFYSPTLDEIHLPQREHFKTAEGFAATLGHELVHWTGAKPRLWRDLSGRFGKQAYAAEELIAELGSAFLLAGLGLASTPHPNHAAYVASWLPLLREDPRAIFVAAAQASRAVEWLFEVTSRGAKSEMPAPSLVRDVDGKSAGPAGYDEARNAVH
ncbi:zincin-like metallopeptidase domain-containing protein [Mesorhizobium sp. LSJC268A00]|uniref:ArdC family protein n=1 Tax=Mesorhizobium sp. LSJC268A00 TaxID=1287325 RepID=UPI001FD8A1B6|nr:zincin-like metallopeptidase domain-containing protein [Mesorhizobium sp. LSJC268A00]